jgi:hypothetical protein
VSNPGWKCRNPGSEIRKSGNPVGNPVGNPGQKTGSEIRVGETGSEIRVRNPGEKSGSEMQKSGFGNPEIRKSGRKSGSENWLGNPDEKSGSGSEMPVGNLGEGLELIEAKLWEHKTDGSR